MRRLRTRGVSGWQNALLVLVSLLLHAGLLWALPASVAERASSPPVLLLALMESPTVAVAEVLASASPVPQARREPQAQPPTALELVEAETSEAMAVADLDPPAEPVSVLPPASTFGMIGDRGERQLAPDAPSPADTAAPVVPRFIHVGPAPADPEPVREVPPPLDLDALLAEYAQGVKAAILAEKRYPPLAERLGHEGVVKVGFTLGSGGELLGLVVKSSSGYAELDKGAMDAVRSAAPFSQIPAGLDRDNLGLAVALEYALR